MVGDTVNVASRLERLTRDLKVELIASDAAVSAAGPEAANGLLQGMHRKDGVSLRGREQHVVNVWVSTPQTPVS